MAAIAATGALLWGWFWNERFWLPANLTWADLERQGADDGVGYPRAGHVLGALPLAVGLLALRRVFESSKQLEVKDFMLNKTFCCLSPMGTGGLT
uniref:Uncharacterized protein n=1 Tax=Sphaerodactylus townsendi TaxID=933632 RepID=A0ACB8ELC4_9SAUR